MVLNDTPTGNTRMMALRRGERQRLTHTTRDTVTQRQIPTFVVRCLTGFLAHRMMGAFGQDRLISLPAVGGGATAAIRGRDGVPHPSAGGSTAIPENTSDAWPRTPTHGGPQPAFVVALIDEGPQRIPCQHSARVRGQQTLDQARHLLARISQPVQHTVSGHTEDASQPAQTGPFSIRLQHVPTAFWRFCRLRHHYARRSTVLAVILRVARLIPTMLDDVFTATRAACVHQGYVNHAADYSASRTLSHHPWVVARPQRQGLRAARTGRGP